MVLVSTDDVFLLAAEGGDDIAVSVGTPETLVVYGVRRLGTEDS